MHYTCMYKHTHTHTHCRIGPSVPYLVPWLIIPFHLHNKQLFFCSSAVVYLESKWEVRGVFMSVVRQEVQQTARCLKRQCYGVVLSDVDSCFRVILTVQG